MNPLFSDLAVRYPAIHKTLFKAISENTLALVNIFKLSIDYIPDCEKMKVLKMSNALAVNALEEDALVSKVKGPSHLLRCFLLYCTILLHFTPSTIWYDLTIGLYAYINHLLGFTMLYTWESVKSFQFIFYRSRISERIADSLGWSHINTHLELLHLVWKPAIAETYTAGPKRGGGLSTG